MAKNNVSSIVLCCCFLATVLLLVNGNIQQVAAFRSEQMSVRVCYPVEFAWGNCELFCKQAGRAITGVVVYSEGELTESQGKQASEACCCLRTLKPPYWLGPQRANVSPKRNSSKINSKRCKSLGNFVQPDKETKQNYESFCSLLNKETPSNMFNAYAGARNGSYLLYMRHTNSQIKQTTDTNDVKNINKESMQAFEEQWFNFFFPYYDDPTAYDGYWFNPRQIKFMYNARKQLGNASRSSIIRDAVDDQCITYALIDMNSAYIRALKINNKYRVQRHHFYGNFDHLPKDKSFEFRQMYDDIDWSEDACKEIERALFNLYKYLDDVKLLFGAMEEKLLFERLVEFDLQTRLMLNSGYVWGKLFEYNCPKKLSYVDEALSYFNSKGKRILTEVHGYSEKDALPYDISNLDNVAPLLSANEAINSLAAANQPATNH